MVMRTAAPSTMAASTTWPSPDRWASSTAHTMPKARNMPPPPKSPTRLSGGTGASPARPIGLEGAGEGDVVDVVAGGLGVRAVLAPPGHAPVDELRVAGEAVVGADAEPLGDAGPEALHDDVGLLDQREHRLDAVGALEVDADRAAAAVEHVGRRRLGVAAHDLAGPVDADDVGAHVGEEHGAERARADPGDLEDGDALQRSHGVMSFLRWWIGFGCRTFSR